MSFNPLLSLARNAKRQKMDMQCDPQWVLDLAAERDQLRAELDAIRGQKPLMYVAMVGDSHHCKGSQARCLEWAEAWNSTVSSNCMKAEVIPLYALPPQQPDAVSVSMSDAELDALWRGIQDTAMREPGLPHIRFARAILAAKVDDAVSDPWPPFAKKVLAKMQRFCECAEDFESGGVDIGRHWLDLLTQLGLLNRVQRSPALWEISQQGEDLLSTRQAEEGE